MKPSLQLRLGQQLTMTPQLQQAIRLLQLSAVDLQLEIQTALETNSMLELQDPQTTADSPSEESTPEEGYTQTNLIERNTHPVTLQEHLLWQMQLTPFSDSDKLIAAALIDSINEDGFLTCSLAEIIQTLKPTEISEIQVQAVLACIQHFDPIGVGARNLGECLKIQLEYLPSPWRDKAQTLVSNHLELLAKRDYQALKRHLQLSLEELQQVINCIQSLHPRPGIKIDHRAAEYIIPDVIAYKKEKNWQVALNQEIIPQLKINTHYASFIQRAHSHSDNQFLKNQLQEARWFLKSIEHRHQTLLKVTQCIVQQQQAFLEHGEKAMKPLCLQDIAQSLSLHESTISRATTHKYLYTPRGTFELKYFFSQSMNTEQGTTCSATAIRALIKKIIATEDRARPLSDQKLATLLHEQGISIARRTIAKYRESLMIPPFNLRKQLA